jgi:hypothetical protein
MSERWKPEKGEIYWMIDFCYTKAVRPMSWAFDWIDTAAYQSGNCFKTEAEAQAAAEKVKALLLSLHESTQVATPDEQLPDWCKVGEWVYSKDEKDYAKLQSLCTIGVNLLFLKENKHYQRNFAYIKHECVQARLRQYTAEEMRELVGKVIEHGDDACAVVHYSRKDGGTIFADGYTHTANELIETGYTIDGKPCGVFEHLENGEWVK